MSKKKEPDHAPIPYKDVDLVRRCIDWHANEIMKLYDQLEPHKSERAFLGGTNAAGTTIYVMFKGCKEDLFMVKECLETLDE